MTRVVTKTSMSFIECDCDKITRKCFKLDETSHLDLFEALMMPHLDLVRVAPVANFQDGR